MAEDNTLEMDITDDTQGGGVYLYIQKLLNASTCTLLLQLSIACT